MGVAPVDFGDGRGPVPIDQSNAKQALQKREELGLNTSQIKYAEKFLSPEEKDEIFYSENESNKRGKEAIGDGDVEKAESHGGQAGNVAASFAPEAIISVLALCPILDGFNQWFCALAANVAGLAGVATAMMYDNGYNDRTSCKDNGDATNETLDGYSSQLEDSMDTMNEDMDEYQDAIDNYTASKNDNTNRQAEVTMQIQDAEAMGDGKKVAELKEQLKGLGEADFSKEEEDMGEIKERLDEYGSLTDEAQGASDGAHTVADFLKEGYWLGPFAAIHAVFYTIAAAASGMAAAGSVPKLAPFFPDAISSGMAKVLLGVAAGMMAKAAEKYGSKAKGEFECGSKGSDMQDHVDTLNDMIGEQTDYVDQTTSDFESADQASAESQGEASKKAGEATQKHGAIYKKPEEKDDDKTGAGSGSGGGGGNGNGKNA